MSRWSDANRGRAGGRHGRPWRAVGAAGVVLTGLLGAGMITTSLDSVEPARPPQPVAEAAGHPGPPSQSADGAPDLVPATEPEADAARPGGITDTAEALPRAEPTTVAIPRIGVNAQVVSLGVNPDGTVEVPPLRQAHLAGWYSRGPSPGETGNAVIVGHVDSSYLGPAVFFELGALLPGDTITVARRDGRSATFRVDAVRAYPKSAFPTELVYGANDRAGLRVVTCGGQFDKATRDYPDNVVVFASLVA